MRNLILYIKIPGLLELHPEKNGKRERGGWEMSGSEGERRELERVSGLESKGRKRKE